LIEFKEQISMTHDTIKVTQDGETVVLEWPADSDLVEPLHDGRLSVAEARELVAERRAEEAAVRRTEIDDADEAATEDAERIRAAREGFDD
jgi:hypothetical protein